jgi:ubiquinone biosynthesis protein
LTVLQDSAPAVPTDEIVKAVEGALGRPLREVFMAFVTVPIAAASIGQVHAATLPDGRRSLVATTRSDSRESSA